METLKRDNVSGFLKKKKGSSFKRIFGKTNLRWFEIQFESQIFGYKVKTTDKKFRGTIPFANIVNFINEIPNQDKKFSEWRFGFQIITIKKVYVLFTQTETELNKWKFSFDILLKKIPEAFPKIKESVFNTAILIYEKHYLESLIKIKLEEEMKIRKQEENLIRKIEENEQEKKRVQFENEERIKQAKLDEMRRQREEERKLIEQEKTKKNLYDLQHETIISEINEKVMGLDEDLPDNEDLMNKTLNKSISSAINYKEDLHDWDFYNDNDEKIKSNELIFYNPIAKETINVKDKQSKIEEEVNGHKTIKNLFKASAETMQQTSPITVTIMSTVEDKVSNTSNQDNNEISNIREISVNKEISQVDQSIHFLPSNSNLNKEKEKEKENNKYKKVKFFKKKTNKNTNNQDSIEISNNLSNISMSNNEDTKAYNDPNLGKSLLTNIPLNTFEKNNGKLVKPSNINGLLSNNSNISIVIVENEVKTLKEKNPHLNYVTKPNENYKEDLLEIDHDREDWLGEVEKKYTRTQKLNNSDLYINRNRANLSALDYLDMSCNEDKKNYANYSLNLEDASDNEFNFSFGSSIGQNKLESSFRNSVENDFKVDYNQNLNKSIQKEEKREVVIVVEEEIKVIVNNKENHVIENIENEQKMVNKNKMFKKSNSLFAHFLGEDDEFDHVLRKQSVSRIPSLVDFSNGKDKKIIPVNIPKSHVMKPTRIIVESSHDDKIEKIEINKPKIDSKVFNRTQSATTWNKQTISTNKEYSSSTKVGSKVKDNGHELSFDKKEEEENCISTYEPKSIESVLNKQESKNNPNSSFIEDFEEW